MVIRPKIAGLGFGVLLCGLVAASCGQPVPTGRVPSVPESVTAVVTGGYWEQGERHGVVRVLVVQDGREELSSRVFLEWLEEGPGRGVRVVQQAALAAINDRTGWSVGIPGLEPSPRGLIVGIAATHAHTHEEKQLRILVRGPGDFEVATKP